MASLTLLRISFKSASLVEAANFLESLNIDTTSSFSMFSAKYFFSDSVSVSSNISRVRPVVYSFLWANASGAASFLRRASVFCLAYSFLVGFFFALGVTFLDARVLACSKRSPSFKGVSIALAALL